MRRIGGLYLAIILLTSAIASSVPFVLADSDVDQPEIQEFSSAVVLVTSSTTLTNAIEFMDNMVLGLSSGSKVGPAVSQAAQWHKDFAHLDKDIKKEFQAAFLAFIKDVKEFLGVGQGVAEKSALYDLEKTALKIKMQNDKADREEKTKAKIKTAIELSNLKETFQDSMSEYVITEKTMKYGPDKEKKLADLKKKNIKLMKEMLIADAKHNDKKLGPDDIKKIDQKVTEAIENSGGQKNGKSDNGDKGKGSDKGNKGKSSDKGKGNGKSKK